MNINININITIWINIKIEIKVNINIIININTNIDFFDIIINIKINKTHIDHCFGTIEHFLARMDMKISEACTEFNFLSI